MRTSHQCRGSPKPMHTEPQNPARGFRCLDALDLRIDVYSRSGRFTDQASSMWCRHVSIYISVTCIHSTQCTVTYCTPHAAYYCTPGDADDNKLSIKPSQYPWAKQHNYTDPGKHSLIHFGCPAWAWSLTPLKTTIKLTNIMNACMVCVGVWFVEFIIVIVGQHGFHSGLSYQAQLMEAIHDWA